MANKRPHGVCDCGEHAWTALTQGYVAFTDAADLAVLAGQSWRAAIRSKEGQRRYVRVVGVLDRFSAKPLASAVTGRSWADHIDNDPTNCRRGNLREADPKKNAANRRPHGTKYKGVQPKGARWKAVIWENGTNRHIGSYQTPELAAAAYNEVAKSVHGEFAWLNPLPKDLNA